MRCLSTSAVQQCANSYRSTTTAGNKGCFHRYGEKQPWSPFLKKGKDPKKANSYRPASLTSSVVKTMERIVNERLKWYLETENLLASEQAGIPTLPKHRGSSHLSVSRKWGRLPRTEVGPGILDWPPESVRQSLDGGTTCQTAEEWHCMFNWIKSYLYTAGQESL